MNRTALFSILSASALVGSAGAVTTAETPVPDLAALTKMAARFAPVDIGADVSKLPAEERQALVHLIEAARQVDAIFIRQVWGGNPALMMDLADDASPLGRARFNYFILNKGPWDRLDHNAPFIPGAPPKPEGANFYPAGATKADVEAWHKTLSESERAAATGFFTAIRRGPGAGRQVHERAVQRRVSGRAGDHGGSAARRGERHASADAEEVPRRRAPTRCCRTITTRATSRGWSSTPASNRPSVRTRSTRMNGSTRRPRTKRSSRCATMPSRRSCSCSTRSCRDSKTRFRSIPNCAIRSLARSRRSASSTSSSPPATPTAACRPRPTTCRTTNA